MTRALLGSAAVFTLLAGAGAAAAGDALPDGGYVASIGSCRGGPWDQRGWPRSEGLRTPAECRVRCDETEGCTAFDLARPQGPRYECTLFGHYDVSGMESESDTCFTTEPSEEFLAQRAYLPQAGSCRAADPRAEPRGGRSLLLTLNEAHELCQATPGCTGFELGRPRQGRFEGRLFTRRRVVGGGGEKGQCFAVVKLGRGTDPDRDRDRDREEQARREPPPLPPFDPRAVVRVEGPACPGGYVAVTYGEADAHRDAVCAKLQRWDVAYLAGGASMDGPGYHCKLRGREERRLGNVLCRPDGTGGR